MSKNIYDIVTNKIIKKLEEGVVPWKRPWDGLGVAVNWVTGKTYRGINTFLLDPGEYATFKQIVQHKGKVKKGEKSHIVVFWKPYEVEDKVTGKKESRFVLRYYNVFEINTQVEGLTSKVETNTHDFNPIEKAEEIANEYKNGPTIDVSSGGAYYIPKLDSVLMPPQENFHHPEGYYSTLFHELVHSTGHESRLKREGIKDISAYGTEVYSKEELVAELGAAMLCGFAGIDNSTIDNNASYIKSWLKALKDDKGMIISAAQQSQKAVDHILGNTFEEIGETKTLK